MTYYKGFMERVSQEEADGAATTEVSKQQFIDILEMLKEHGAKSVKVDIYDLIKHLNE